MTGEKRHCRVERGRFRVVLARNGRQTILQPLERQFHCFALDLTRIAARPGLRECVDPRQVPIPQFHRQRFHRRPQAAAQPELFVQFRPLLQEFEAIVLYCMLISFRC